jgi:hypothetical protein
VNERGRLQGVRRPLAGHVTPGEAAQLVVDDGHQLSERLFVALTPGLQQGCDVMRRL